MIDYCGGKLSGACTVLFAPLIASRKGKAKIVGARYDAAAKTIATQSQVDCYRILSEGMTEAQNQFTSSVREDQFPAEISNADVNVKLQFQERRRLANLQSVVSMAALDLGSEQVDDLDPDPDWATAFFDDAQDVSDEDLKKIWARILAQEVRRPGTTSKRTLATLKLLSKVEAEQFASIGSFVFGDDSLLRQDNLREKFNGLQASNLFAIRNSGLINLDSQAVLSLNNVDFVRIPLAYQGGVLVFKKGSEGKSNRDIPVYKLTTAGCELARISEPKPDFRFLMELATFLQTIDTQLHFLADGTLMCPDQMVLTESTLIRPPT